MSTFCGPVDAPDKYELVMLRSSGGEGALWQGRLPVDSVYVDVAVKVILPGNVGDISAWHERWIRQAEILKSINYPGLVAVREVFRGPVPHEAGAASPDTETLYMVMNWVAGDSLDEWVARNPNRDALESLRVIGGLAAAVDYLHNGAAVGQPLLHRDIKPANVIINGRDVRLVDFGFVRTKGSGQPMTRVGSAGYAAPEVALGREPSEASDRFAVAATAYYALTGESPDLDQPAAMLGRLNEVPGLEDRHEVHTLLLTMLDPDPTRRPQSLVQWAQGLVAMSVVGGGHTSVSMRNEPPPAPAPAVTPSEPPSVQQAPKKKRRAVKMLGIVGLFLVVAALSAGAVWYVAGDRRAIPATQAATDDSNTSADAESSDQSVDVEVGQLPAVAGLLRDAAEQALTDAGYTDVTVNTEQTNDAEPGTVLSQVPAAGTEAESGIRVVLVVADSAPIEVPAVMGATAADAAATLGDLGFLSVETVEADSVEAAGTVIGQEPAAGSEIGAAETVVLTIARAVSTPDFSAMPIADIRTFVQDLGGTTETVNQYDLERENGAFVSQSPQAGQPLTSPVTITVAEGPAGLFLAELDPVDSDDDGLRFFEDQAGINGDVYLHSLVLQDNYDFRNGTAFLEYNLSRDFDRLRATIGYNDVGSADGIARVEIFGDGRKLYERDFALGDAEEVSLDISTVLRLKIQVTELVEEESIVVLGSIELLGRPEVIARYSAETEG